MNYQEKSYEEISEHISKLLDINPDDLDGESLRGPRIFGEINKIYIQRSRKLRDLSNQLKSLEFSRKRHYGGKETAEHYKKNPLKESILKTEIDSWIDIDPLVVEMRQLVKEEDCVVKLIEDAKVSLRWRGSDIKNAIEFRKLMLGA